MNHLLTELLFRLVTRRSKSPKIAGNLRVLGYPLPMKLLLAVGVCVFAYGGYYLAYDSSHPDTRILFVMGPISLALFIGLMELVFGKVTFDDSCLYKKSPWSFQRRVWWGDITGVSYSDMKSCYTLSTVSQGDIRISKYMNGLDALLAMLRAQKLAVPRES